MTLVKKKQYDLEAKMLSQIVNKYLEEIKTTSRKKSTQKYSNIIKKNQKNPVLSLISKQKTSNKQKKAKSIPFKYENIHNC